MMYVDAERDEVAKVMRGVMKLRADGQLAIPLMDALANAFAAASAKRHAEDA